jgi:hypothetical protein
MSRLIFISTLYLVMGFLPQNVISQHKKVPQVMGKADIVFRHLVGQQALVLEDSIYTNPFGENYSLRKFKYYISNSCFFSGGKVVSKNNYYLVDQSIDNSKLLHLQLPENSYDSIRFLIGVDSAMNTKGAQSGALDPLNDMYWTWQSGYIMQKLEGSSAQSNVVNNKMEYHLGGYSGENKAQRWVTIRFKESEQLQVKKGQLSSIIIDVDINKFWQGNKMVKISETPVCSTPGLMTSQLADNFSSMFSLKNIVISQ